MTKISLTSITMIHLVKSAILKLFLMKMEHGLDGMSRMSMVNALKLLPDGLMLLSPRTQLVV
jgi:hypothetical protein